MKENRPSTIRNSQRLTTQAWIIVGLTVLVGVIAPALYWVTQQRRVDSAAAMLLFVLISIGVYIGYRGWRPQRQRARAFDHFKPLVQDVASNITLQMIGLRGEHLSLEYKGHTIHTRREYGSLFIRLDFYGQVRLGGVTNYQHNGKTYCIYGKRFESREDLPPSLNETQLRQILDDLIAAKQAWQSTLTTFPTGKDVLLNKYNQLTMGLLILACAALIAGYAANDPQKGLVLTLSGFGILIGLMIKYVILKKWGKEVSARG